MSAALSGALFPAIRRASVTLLISLPRGSMPIALKCFDWSSPARGRRSMRRSGADR